MSRIASLCAAMACVITALLGCAAHDVGREHTLRGDEIVIAGRFFHTGTKVVLWTQPGGYDAYRVERRFVSPDKASWDASKDGLDTPNRYGTRRVMLTDEQREQVRGGGWDLELLRQHVDQFVLHYDAAGTSRQCFKVLHDDRGLSIHFLIDLDGTIYQTLDVKERAWHATKANDRSVGVEIANIGAYSPGQRDVLARWYSRDPCADCSCPTGPLRVQLPSWMGDGGVRTPGFVARPARDFAVAGTVQGQELTQYDFTPEQYRALAHLTAALHAALPAIALDFPRDEHGNLVTSVLSDQQWRSFRGVLGHYHVQEEKIDPGPAMDWDRLMREARRLSR